MHDTLIVTTNEATRVRILHYHHDFVEVCNQLGMREHNIVIAKCHNEFFGLN